MRRVYVVNKNYIQNKTSEEEADKDTKSDIDKES